MKYYIYSLFLEHYAKDYEDMLELASQIKTEQIVDMIIERYEEIIKEDE